MNRFLMSEAIRAAYKNGEDDEAMQPICLVDKNNNPIGRIKNGDYVIFYDIRGEREIELTESFTDPNFNHFPVDENIRTHWATMIEYDPKLDVKVAFPPIGALKNTLAEVLSKAGKKLCKISESEKAIHLQFFMNGKQMEPFPGESRIAIESYRTNHMDKYPDMKAKKVADTTIEKLKGDDDVIVVNLANIDVLGHIENKPAIFQAVQTVDAQVGRLVETAKQMG
ncbi:alkaline phosphatase family protein, partial [candidate division KSB1 bacterium]|nr:alkaline phosphatase family protein [candidate division KSB1 bacterium]